MTSSRLVLVHGAGCDRRVWDSLSPLLPEGTVALDLPGRLGAEPACATAAEAAKAVFAEIGARGLATRDAVIVGHSYGGAVAIECALAEAIAGLVLISTGARLRVHPDVLAELPSQSASVPRETTRVDWHAADAFDRMHDVARITSPTLVIAGDRDVLTPPKYARYLAAKIPGSRLVLLEGAGHTCITDDAARVAAAITAWRSGQGNSTREGNGTFGAAVPFPT